ncbi:hypothetical protein M0R45_019868 [Rubus argutus]|uniref:Uncharacterized protein n=1 Tax=Rubus argutus TaxID=59490 RepID=A0AAW1XA32_RUBAR
MTMMRRLRRKSARKLNLWMIRWIIQTLPFSADLNLIWCKCQPSGAKRYLDCSGNWTSKLYMHVGDDASVDVGVVKSNTTVKFSHGFATFMKANDINKGNPLLFSRIDEKEFLDWKL